MSTQLQFKPSFGGTAIYLAMESRQWNAETTPEWVTTIRPFANSLNGCLATLGLSSDHLWLGLLNAATQFESNQELAAIFLKRVKGTTSTRPDDAPRLTAAISSLEGAVRKIYPELENELSLRVGPLREQWEARGPGLLHHLSRTTDPDLLPATANVALVTPIRGGGGIALLPSNTVLFEGVLTNGDAALPETLRLAWLVAQLQLDLPKFSEAIHASRLPRVASLALLPPILEAAFQVELTPSSLAESPEALAHAIEAWISPQNNAQELGETLVHWRETQIESQTPWRVALTGLDRLIGD